LAGRVEVNEDDLKKLGLRLRPRVVKSEQPQQTKAGHISFDDRGNAVFEWDNERLSAEGEDADRLRQKALDHPGLSLIDEEPVAATPIRSNPKGLRVGYNPYESGVLAKKDVKRKRDLRELSKWIEKKRQTSGGANDD
jgi:hypothetical protein